MNLSEWRDYAKQHDTGPDPEVRIHVDDFRQLLDVVEAAQILRVFLDDEIGMDKTELTMLRSSLSKLEMIK